MLGVATGTTYSGGAPSSLPLVVCRIMRLISDHTSTAFAYVNESEWFMSQSCDSTFPRSM
jgi:hypothetical protein